MERSACSGTTRCSVVWGFPFASLPPHPDGVRGARGGSGCEECDNRDMLNMCNRALLLLPLLLVFCELGRREDLRMGQVRGHVTQLGAHHVLGELVGNLL